MSTITNRLREIALGVSMYGAPDKDLLASRIDAIAIDLESEARRLKALMRGIADGVPVTPGMSPADVETARQAVQAMAGATGWEPGR